MKLWTVNELSRQRALWLAEQSLNELRVCQAAAYPGIDVAVARFNAANAKSIVEQIDEELARR